MDSKNNDTNKSIKKEEKEEIIPEVVTPKKRGRKKKEENKYWDEPQEQAVRDFLKSTDEYERNLIYNTYLKHAFFKLIENIANTFKLYSHKLSFDDLLDDTLNFLHTKIDKFNPNKLNSKGEKPKSYSYYGTIVKNRLMANRIKENKEMKRYVSYEDTYKTIVEDERNSYEMIEESSLMVDYFYEFIKIIEDVLNKDEKLNQTFLKPNERKIGYSITFIMRNWESLFHEGGKKYNKNQILECLRQMTGLSTKEIRDSNKKFKLLYFKYKKQKIKKDFD